VDEITSASRRIDLGWIYLKLFRPRSLIKYINPIVYKLVFSKFTDIVD